MNKFSQVYDGDDLPDTYVKINISQNMRVSKTKKTSLVRRNLSPAFNQSFDIKLTEKCVGTTFLTVQLKQARLFALKGCKTFLRCQKNVFLMTQI